MGETVANEATEALDAAAAQSDRTVKRPAFAASPDMRKPNVDLSVAVIRTWMDQENRRSQRSQATADPSAP